MEFVQRWCEDRGIQYLVVAKDPNRPNVIATIEPSTDGPTIAMNGHLDTVPVSDAAAWRTGPFEPVVSDDGVRTLRPRCLGHEELGRGHVAPHGRV